MIPLGFRIALQRFACLMLAYSLTRLAFLLWNWSTFYAVPLFEIGAAFLVGLRFDASILLLSNAICFLIWLLPSRVLVRPSVRALDWTCLAVINFIALGLNLVDMEFVKFIGKRTSYDLFFIGQDLRQQAPSILLNYWYVLLGLILFVGLILKGLKPLPRSAVIENPLSGGVWRLAVAVLAFLGIRGGVGFKPLSPLDAFFSTRHEIGLLALNTPFNILRTRPEAHIERARYFATDREAILRLKELNDLSRPPLALAKNFNVVVLILESFGDEYTGIANSYPGYTPFFDSLAKKALYFPRNFANARRSIDGIPAVLCGLPAMMGEPFLTSDFSSNRTNCLPRILNHQGYSTYFLHGAHNGSMHFDAFSRMAGFENFVGLNEYPKTNSEDLDRYWGVLDEPMLQYAIQTIDQAPKPVMLSVFTLSSHFPYYIPEKYKGKFPRGTLEIHESIGYTDYALEQFFKVAETKPWFNKTIFVLVADHTQKSEHEEYQSMTGVFRVPLAVYAPGLKREDLPLDPSRVTQQIDILPSVLDLLGINVADRLLVGHSVFDLKKEGCAYNYTSTNYWYLTSHRMVDMGRPPHPLQLFTHQDAIHFEPASRNDHFDADLKNVKAVVHYMNEGLVHNSLYDWDKALTVKNSTNQIVNTSEF